MAIGRRGQAVGEEQWSPGPSADYPGEQVGGVGVPVDLAGDPALAGDGGGFVLQVEVADIEAEDLVGAGRGVIRQPPQRFLPHGQVGPVPQRFQLTSGNDLPVGVATQAAPLDRRAGIVGDQVLAEGVAVEGPQGGQVEVPGGRSSAGVPGVHEGLQVGRAQLGKGCVWTGVPGQAGEGLAVDGDRAGAEVALGKEAGGGPGQGNGLLQARVGQPRRPRHGLPPRLVADNMGGSRS